jgi:hypothetical protein
MNTRRAVIMALLSSPLSLKAQIEEPAKTNDIYLSESFKLTIHNGKNSLVLSSREIWEALTLARPSTLL